MTATTPGCGSTTDAKKRLAEQNGDHVPHWDPAIVQLIEQARAEGAAEVVARVRALAAKFQQRAGACRETAGFAGDKDSPAAASYRGKARGYDEAATALRAALRGPR